METKIRQKLAIQNNQYSLVPLRKALQRRNKVLQEITLNNLLKNVNLLKTFL